jgi:phage terminase large subunit-like protein
MTWLVMAGRGFGKTRTGAEWIKDQVCNHGRSRLALVARTAADARDVMVEGESGILAVSPDNFRPKYEPSKRRLTWPNGAIATTYSAEEGDQLRGPQHDGAWADEIAAWDEVHRGKARPGEADRSDTWDMLVFGIRLGKDPRICGTTTPKPVALIRKLIKSSTTVVTRGHTLENEANLAASFVANVVDAYAGTRLGRQELAGELLEDVLGALWTYAQFEAGRISRDQLPELDRVVVAVDPSGSDDAGNSEQGIVVAGRSRDRQGYVLGDYSGRYTPDGWGRKAVQAYLDHEADAIVVETNFGGDMAINTIRHAAEAMSREGHPTSSVSIKKVVASRGKAVRAEPISGLYEQGRVHHVGTFPLLETQMATWLPGSKSPDRLDALVWALTDLVVATRKLEWS